MLIYFGGYGIQAGRQNYFVPIGAQIWTEPDVVRDGVSIESVLAALNATGARVKLAVLDLSRRNPMPLNTVIISAAGLRPIADRRPRTDLECRTGKVASRDLSC